MAEINLDIGHALSRQDQRQNRRQPYFYIAVLPLILSPEIARRSSQKNFEPQITRIARMMRMTKIRGPRMTRTDTKIQSKEKSFALIRVIRGQTCLSLLFQGGTRCPLARRSDAKAAQRIGKVTAAFRLIGFASAAAHLPSVEPDWRLQPISGYEGSCANPVAAPL
jgi:hypothetical protein